MADAYSFVKKGKLKLKGVKKKSFKKHGKKRKHEDTEGDDTDYKAEEKDTEKHGGYWKAKTFEEISGGIALEFSYMTYVQALDNGLFSLGEMHENGQGPDPPEILTASRADDGRISLKSGYGKYLSVNADGVVIGRSDAVGQREQWEPVFQEKKLAISGCNGCFLSVTDDGELICRSKTAGPNEFVTVRNSLEKEAPTDNKPKEEKGGVKSTEINYVKKFQSFQDRRLRVNEEDTTALKRAKADGKFHQELLDRREKMKADRYCK